METIAPTQPETTRLAWITPQVYDLNGTETEGGIVTYNIEDAMHHPGAS
jgi:hypothetical protein